MSSAGPAPVDPATAAATAAAQLAALQVAVSDLVSPVLIASFLACLFYGVLLYMCASRPASTRTSTTKADHVLLAAATYFLRFGSTDRLAFKLLVGFLTLSALGDTMKDCSWAWRYSATALLDPTILALVPVQFLVYACFTGPNVLVCQAFFTCVDDIVYPSRRRSSTVSSSTDARASSPCRWRVWVVSETNGRRNWWLPLFLLQLELAAAGLAFYLAYWGGQATSMTEFSQITARSLRLPLAFAPLLTSRRAGRHVHVARCQSAVRPPHHVRLSSSFSLAVSLVRELTFLTRCTQGRHHLLPPHPPYSYRRRLGRLQALVAGRAHRPEDVSNQRRLTRDPASRPGASRSPSLESYSMLTSLCIGALQVTIIAKGSTLWYSVPGPSPSALEPLFRPPQSLPLPLLSPTGFQESKIYVISCIATRESPSRRPLHRARTRSRRPSLSPSQSTRASRPSTTTAALPPTAPTARRRRTRA